MFCCMGGRVFALRMTAGYSAAIHSIYMDLRILVKIRIFYFFFVNLTIKFGFQKPDFATWRTKP